MSDADNYIELVKKAQRGDEDYLNRLTELARERLQVYVYRLTLEDAKSEDIVQESMLEMFKILGKLKEADRFWPWLYGIAINKIRRHERTERRQRTVSASDVGYGGAQKNEQEGLENLVSQELKQMVSSAMRGLRTRHRAVLAMRCYDEMSYSEIAESLGCSEFAARMLFCRAKRARQKQLARRGLGKGTLLTALVLFGKMTAPTEAAAANVSVTSTAVKAGVAAGLATAASSKMAIVTLTTAGVLAVGTMVATSGPDRTIAGPVANPVRSLQIVSPSGQANRSVEQCWYYFPKGPGGPVMLRLMRADAGGEQLYCSWRQNESGNFYFDARRDTFYVRNYPMWRDDFGVRRLPTDNVKLSEFLSQVEGRGEDMEYVRGSGDGLLVIARRRGDENSERTRVIRHYNVLEEEYFRYNLPAGAKVVDERDAMHRRGWTYFRISGEINGKEVLGGGRMPFVYAVIGRYSPWLRLETGEKEVVDDSFMGLGRPWMGLHTIDTVRRDAAERQIWFETEYEPSSSKGKVRLTSEEGEMEYTIDMEKDVVERIAFSRKGSDGELRFEYLEDVENVGSEFVRPRRVGRKEECLFAVLWGAE